MATWNDVVAIAQTLPQTEVSTWYGTPGIKVAGKGFARLRSESDGGVVLLCSLDEKARLLESGEPAYYTTAHYDGFGSILVNLSLVDPLALHELVVQAWKTKAPRKLGAPLLGVTSPRAARSTQSRGRTRAVAPGPTRKQRARSK